MKIILSYKSKSYKSGDGKWIPSGLVTIKDEISITEFTETYSEKGKATKSEADIYFTTNIKNLYNKSRIKLPA